jgi:hypothetical protein
VLSNVALFHKDYQDPAYFSSSLMVTSTFVPNAS